MSTIVSPDVYIRGYAPENQLGNGRPAISNAGVKLAAFTNMLVAKRKNILFSSSVRPTDVAGSFAETRFWSFRFHTSATATKIRVSIIAIPASSTSVADNPRVNFVYQRQTPSVGLPNSNQQFSITRRKTGTIVPDDYFVLTRDYTEDIVGDRVYDAFVSGTQYARVISVSVYEVPENTLTTNVISPTSDSAVIPSQFNVSAAVTDAAISDISTTLYTVWKRQGIRQLTWAGLENTPVTTTSASYVNLFDGTSTGWSVNTPGFQIDPYKHGTMTSLDVPTTFWVYAKVSSGTGYVRYLTQNGQVAELTVTAISSTWISTTGFLRSANATDKLDIQGKTDGGVTLSLYAATVYEYEA